MTFEDFAQVYSSFIGAGIGAVIGAIAAFFFALLLERRREKSALMIENRREKMEREKEIEFRKRIASTISQELETYSRYLEFHLINYEIAPPNEKMSNSIELLRDFKTLSRHYINITPEIKAKVFDIDTTTTLEKVYQFTQILTTKLEERLLSQRAQLNDFEAGIKMLKHDISKGLESIRNMKID